VPRRDPLWKGGLRIDSFTFRFSCRLLIIYLYEKENPCPGNSFDFLLGMGVAATTFNIPLPMPPLRQQ